MIWQCDALGDDLEYAWYIYKNDDIIEKRMYSQSNTIEIEFDQKGEYSIKVFVRNKYGVKSTFRTEKFKVEEV